MDILKIVLMNKLQNRIAGINVKENFVQLNVKFPADHPHSKEIRENIEYILSEYGFICNGSPQEETFDPHAEQEENNFSV